MKKSAAIGVLSFALIALLGATGLTAQINVSTGVMPLPPNTYGQWVVDIDFGGTQHSENLSFTLTNTVDGFVMELYDIGGMSRANTGADWTPHAPIWNFPSQPAGTWNLTFSGGAYPTESLSGTHRFVFNITNPNATLQNDITFTVANGGATTASVVGTPFFHVVTGTPASGTPGAVTGTSSTAYIEHSAAFAFGISTLGASADQVRFEFDVDFGSTATQMHVSVFALLDVGTNQVIFDLYSLADDGGSSPSASCPVTAGGTVAFDARSFQTAAHTGMQKFRVVVRAGTPFTGSHLTNFYVSWDTVNTLGAAPATAATQNTPGLSITPGGGSITSGATLTAQGGTAPTSYAWSVVSGTGSVTPGTGGTTTLTGSGTVTVRLANGAEWVEETYNFGGGGGGTLTISSPSSLPNGVQGSAYGPVTVTATGGTPPYTWSATGLPTGVSINPSTGEISGNPSVNGTFSPVTVTVTDSTAATDDQTYSIDIAPTGGLIILTSSLANGTVGTGYSQTINATGGTGPYTWSVSGGTLPTGLSLGSSTSTSVAITGNPSVANTFNFTIQIQDSAAGSDTQAFTVTIAAGGGGGGGGGISGGGGGGGGCSSGGSHSPWLLLALAPLALLVLRKRRTA